MNLAVNVAAGEIFKQTCGVRVTVPYVLSILLIASLALGRLTILVLVAFVSFLP